MLPLGDRLREYATNLKVKERIMKTCIIRLAIGFTALVASFLPQKAEAFLYCSVTCPNGACDAIGWNPTCTCDTNGNPVCGA